MTYRPSPGAYSNIFAVPSGALEHVKLAPPLALRALLLVCGTDEALDEASVSARLGCSPEEAGDALGFWVKQGLIEERAQGSDALPKSRAVTAAAQNAPETKTDAQAADKKEALPRASGTERRQNTTSRVREVVPAAAPDKLPAATLKSRATEDPEVARLLKESQSQLGRTLSPSDENMLLDLHDAQGLDTEIILTLLSCARVTGRERDRTYIHEVGRLWGEKGYKTCHAAQRYFTEEAKCDALWQKLCGAGAGEYVKLSFKNVSQIRKWLYEYGFSPDQIVEAYRHLVSSGRMSAEKFSFAVMDRTLTGWFDAGVTDAAEAEKLRSAAGTAKKKARADSKGDAAEAASSREPDDIGTMPVFTDGMSKQDRRRAYVASKKGK
ncbi:MAG: DnaD domain protein [Clostridia bacterium]|nr:DnaD domain protein [Clostridia bacterium]